MSPKTEQDPATRRAPPDAEWGWEAHRDDQLRLALKMTPAQRLAWLERANESMRGLLGRARNLAPADERSSASD